MNDPFEITISDYKSVIKRNYNPDLIKLDVPFKVGVEYFCFGNSFYNITKNNNTLCTDGDIQMVKLMLFMTNMISQWNLVITN